jgi:hypothetical protein
MLTRAHASGGHFEKFKKEISKLGCHMIGYSDVMIFECCRPWTKSANKKKEEERTNITITMQKCKNLIIIITRASTACNDGFRRLHF